MGEAFIQPDLCVFTQKKVLSGLGSTCLAGLKRNMEIISFSVVHQNPDKPVFFVCVCVPDLLEYSPSTHEGRFLVVPATLPGRQEHLTVCERSSIRFLLQHL